MNYIDKARSLLFGLAVGDAFGVPVEERFQIVKEVSGITHTHIRSTWHRCR